MVAARQYDDNRRGDSQRVQSRKRAKLKVVRNESVLLSSHKKLMFKALFMAAILLVIGVGFTAYGTTMKYNINQTESKIASLEIEINELSLQVTTSTSPETIESRAINELGMEYPSSSQYVYIETTTGESSTADNN